MGERYYKLGCLEFEQLWFWFFQLERGTQVKTSSKTHLDTCPFHSLHLAFFCVNGP